MGTATMSGQTSRPSPSTTLTTQSDLSLYYKFLRSSIRPFKPRFAKPGKALPPGSNKHKHPTSRNGCSIVAYKHEPSGFWLYDFKSSNPSSNHNGHNKTNTDSSTTSDHLPSGSPRHHVYYFNGGSFMMPPTDQHWAFVSKLAADLQDHYDFTLVSYPLAPKCPAPDSLPLIREFLRSVLEDKAAKGEKISLMGDSSGGNLAFGLAMWWANELEQAASTQDGFDSSSSSPPPAPAVNESGERQSRAGINGIDDGADGRENSIGAIAAAVVDTASPKMRNVLVNAYGISLSADHRYTNPELEKLDRVDPVLALYMEKHTSEQYLLPSPKTGEVLVVDDPYVSLICQPPSTFENVKKHGIQMHGIIGTCDLVAPDCELLREKLVEYDVPGEWLVWKGQMHCFPLVQCYKVPEGVKATRWLEDLLKKNVQT